MGKVATDVHGVSTRGQHHTLTSCSISMRHAFVPFKGGVILAADYSQLELRILAHLSGDRKLRNILNSGGDVFKTIAAQWKGVDIDNISDTDRQQAKQVCYGMIYGIGPKALGEQIGLDEEDAAVFMESFKSKYSGIRKYLQVTVQKCREMGYVETISGRRRYLPAIRDKNVHTKSHAERQAVNTTVQGSAADLVKKAMINIDAALWQMYPDTRITHKQKRVSSGSATCCHGSHTQCNKCSLRGAFFVLQLHDELIYEVNEQDLNQVAALVKYTMESAMKLSVCLPVKLKMGPTWGSIEEIHI
ncbi:hypothetical protein LSH36_9g16022 [Paralvinella palmiformis]|uniref:DNA-directed DNA polymerase n=1 Tax=Paralvinella palmiformis TaxID=53620 RepID=A0AAD9KD77_9ANNE|nr:hypothetical protein LSH36_9g16022 [Paralvinella palmiformis]